MTTFRWTLGRVVEALEADDTLGGLATIAGELDSDAAVRSIATDTRRLEPGDLFLALRGENFDGHDFLAAALRKGAAGLIVADDAELSEPVLRRAIRVADPLRALGVLARYRRRALTAPVVAITGSSGKTTTRELLRSALAGWTEVHSTGGNLNNRIGLPRTVLECPTEVGAVVLEAGTSEPGEIAALAAVAEPDVAVVTTVGEAHLEGLGSFEGILEEKLDLVRGMRPDGTAFVGEDPAELPARAGMVGRRVQTVGFGERASPGARGEALERTGAGSWSFRWRGRPVRISIPGRHVALDALLALAVADHLGAPVEGAIAAVEEYRGGALRDELRRIGPLSVIVDCYNANPQSTGAALQALADRSSEGPRVAILGSMLELGERERAAHLELLEFAAGLPLDLLVLTGAFADAAPAVEVPHEWIVAHDPLELWPRLRDRLDDDRPATLLLKGSRGVALERLLPLLEEEFGGGED